MPVMASMAGTMGVAGGQVQNVNTTSVEVNLGPVTIANDMDLALFEARVKQVVSEAIG